jgi:hypothetical protein
MLINYIAAVCRDNDFNIPVCAPFLRKFFARFRYLRIDLPDACPASASRAVQPQNRAVPMEWGAASRTISLTNHRGPH